jgi:hypothetical protein
MCSSRGAQIAGASFESTVNLSNDAKVSDSPGIAVIGSNVYVVWSSHESISDDVSIHAQLSFKKSTDNGHTFSGSKTISDEFDFITPKIAAAGSNVYIAFEAGRHSQDRQLYFTRSTNEGSIFSKAISIHNGNVSLSSFPEMAAKGHNVYVVLVDTQENLPNRNIQFKRSIDDGKSFESAKDFGQGAWPVNLDLISNNVYVVWPGDVNQGTSGIFFRASTNNGSSFGSTKALSNGDFATNPHISSSGTAVRIVWQEDIHGTNGTQRDILFRTSGNEGSSFDNTKNLSNNEGDSTQPQIISSGGNVYVVWTNSTDGGYKTFFKKGVD